MAPRTRALSVLALLFALVAADASAQVIQRPPRSTGGLFGGRRPADPNRSSQELSLTLNLLGGWDDNVAPDGQLISLTPFSSRESDLTGTVSGSIDYRRGSLSRAIEASGQAFVNSFRNLGTRPFIGGGGSVRAFGRFFDKTNLSVRGEAHYQPTFMFGSFGAPAPDGAQPATDPTAGISELRTINGNAVATLVQDWNIRQRTNLTYSFTRHRFLSLGGSSMQSHAIAADQTWNFSRNAGLQASYRFNHQISEDALIGSRPLDSNGVTLGMELRRPISRNRRLVFNGSAGAMRVSTLSAVDNSPFEYTAPFGLGSVRLDMGRTWSLSADMRREVTMLQGVTQQSFLTTSGSVWLGGVLARRWTVSVTGIFSEGAPHEGETGSFESKGGTAQLLYDLTSGMQLMTSYSYYQHHLRDVVQVPTGFPSRFERNTVRFGMTIFLPLYGTFAPAGQR